MEQLQETVFTLQARCDRYERRFGVLSADDEDHGRGRDEPEEPDERGRRHVDEGEPHDRDCGLPSTSSRRHEDRRRDESEEETEVAMEGVEGDRREGEVEDDGHVRDEDDQDDQDVRR